MKPSFTTRKAPRGRGTRPWTASETDDVRGLGAVAGVAGVTAVAILWVGCRAWWWVCVSFGEGGLRTLTAEIHGSVTGRRIHTRLQTARAALGRPLPVHMRSARCGFVPLTKRPCPALPSASRRFLPCVPMRSVGGRGLVNATLPEPASAHRGSQEELAPQPPGPVGGAWRTRRPLPPAEKCCPWKRLIYCYYFIFSNYSAPPVPGSVPGARRRRGIGSHLPLSARHRWPPAGRRARARQRGPGEEQGRAGR